MNSDTLLATLAGSTAAERLQVVLVRSSAGDSRIALRQQSWAEGIGWYDQKSLDLAPTQLHELRGVLGWVGGLAGRARPPVPTDGPAILPFPGARVETA